MKFDIKIIALVILAILLTFQFSKCSSNKEKEKLMADLHKEILKGDKLKKISDTQYEKLVADTLTIKQLKNVVSDLGLKVDNPKIVTRIVYQQKDVEKPVDGVVVKEDSLFIEDYYPNKEKSTLKYTANVNIKTKKGVGKFKFQPQGLDLIVSETAKGLWKTTLKTDNEFVTINSVDVQSLPSVTSDKTNNWGTLGGLKYNMGLSEKSENVEVIGGIRYKRVNIIGSANTNKQVGIGLLFEF